MLRAQKPQSGSAGRCGDLLDYSADAGGLVAIEVRILVNINRD